MTGSIMWITGFPASGKTTLARSVRTRLQQQQVPCCVLDSDDVRRELVPAPGYDDAGRDSFYRTLANLAAMLARQGLVVLVPATANRRTYRRHARSIAPRYFEVHVETQLNDCAERDPKGLYARVRSGDNIALPGANAPYEAPESPDVRATGGFDLDAVDAMVALASG